MKTDIHPDYRPVVFYDTAAGTGLLPPTITSTQIIEWSDGYQCRWGGLPVGAALLPG